MTRLARDFVTIVTGVPRAGTSLLMQVLEAGGIAALTDGARAPDASNPRGYFEHALVPRLGRDPRAAALVRGARGRALKVIHALLPALPADVPLRVLVAERALADVVASQAGMLARNAPALRRVWSQTPNANLLRPAPGSTPSQTAPPLMPPERLAAVYAAQLAESLALLAARPGCLLLRVDTALLVQAPAPECARIAAFLGGGLDEAAMARAISPALYGRSREYRGAMDTASPDVAARELLGPLALEVEHRTPGASGGPTLRAKRVRDGYELFRFDCFVEGAHWHDDSDGRDQITPIPLALDAIDFAVAELRRDLAGYAARAGLREALPPAADCEAALARLELALRNPPPTFDALSEDVLRARSGEKWHQYGPEPLALWVADMDFEAAMPVRRRLARALAVGDLGYPQYAPQTRLPDLAAQRMLQRFGYAVPRAQVEVVSEVVQAMHVALLQLTQPGDGVITQTPIYPPFLGVIKDHGRTLLANEMARGARGYELDLDDLRAKARQARLLLLCNPHNPTGRCFRRDELEAVAAIAREHELWVVSDEIHADLVFAPSKHIPFASLSDDAASRTITLYAASKAFNIAGLRCAVAIFGTPELKKRFNALPRHVRGGLNGPGILATEAAWTHGDLWLSDCLAYLRANRDYVADFALRELPCVVHFAPEATYLAWLDCRALSLTPSPHEYFLKHARVALSEGPNFGEPGRGFVRLNFATSRAILTRALEQMAKAVRG
jgi:cystathionine beta-lyase